MGTESKAPAAAHDWKAERRQRAYELHSQGWSNRLIATAFGVSEAAVSQWLRRAREQGPEALAGRARPGAPPKLTPGQLRLVPDLLSHGAEAYGFRGEVWTCARVARVIQEEFGVSYHPAHVSRLLKRLNWTPQVPLVQASQRDETQIEAWRTTHWPALLQQAQREGQTIVFVDEAAFYLLAGKIMTYAPRGQTPVLRVPYTHDHFSVMSGLTPAGELYTLVREFALTSHESVLFLQHLSRHLATPLLVIWDGAPIHRTKEIPPFLATVGTTALWLEALPSYAPDLNPVEGVWRQLKLVELANVACHELLELRDELDLAFSRLRRHPALLRSFFAEARLALPPA
jgi:transposase